MDYYSQRLSEKKKSKADRLAKVSLPMGRPNGQAPSAQNALRTMAGTPQQPQEQDPNAGIAGSGFKTVFENLSKDDGFKNGMAEFATIMKTMNKDMQGLNLPPEVMRRKVEQVVQKYVQGSQGLNSKIQEAAMAAPQQEQPMGEPQNGY